jgi:hypothetical protein
MRVVLLKRKDLQIFRECKFVEGKSKHKYQFSFLGKNFSGMKEKWKMKSERYCNACVFFQLLQQNGNDPEYLHAQTGHE